MKLIIFRLENRTGKRRDESRKEDQLFGKGIKTQFMTAFDQTDQFVIGDNAGPRKVLWSRSITRSGQISRTAKQRFGALGEAEFLLAGAIVFAGENLLFHQIGYPNPRVTSLGAGHQETLIGDKASEGDPTAKTLRHLLNNCRVFHFHDTSPTARVRQYCYVGDDRWLMPDAANLAAILYRLRSHNETVYRRIVATIRQVAPFFDDFNLELSGSGNKDIILNWRHRKSDLIFGPHQLSDGTLRAICLISLLMQPADELPYLIVVDEPELGLHPYALNVIASLFQAASHHTQVLVSTQSGAFLDSFDAEDIVVVERDGEASKFGRPDADKTEAWLEDYSLGEVWEKNVSWWRSTLMARLYLFAEGQTEQTFADTVLKPHLANHSVYMHNPVLIAHARKKGKEHHGGGRNFIAMQNDLVRFLKQESASDVFFTSMIDLYALHKGFPGTEEAEKYRHDPYQRVEALEAAWAETTGDGRFIPFIQLHEYEAYLFADVSQMSFSYDNADSAIKALQKIVDGVASPELIDDGPHTAPSKRIIDQFPAYEDTKTIVGPQAAERIGLTRIRSKCPHFAKWLERLEQLGTET